MCINPKLLPNGASVPCHQCWQCRENRINDWVGRCIAERESCLASTVVTLTYGGGDTPQSRFLRKSDITAWMKAIRGDGHKVRVFYVGEYGSKKGRAHWHAVLFWHSKMPYRELRKNIDDEWWPHGYSFWDDADAASIRYVMKYINKNVSDKDGLKTMGMSRKPILGWQFFQELAGRYIDQGLSPQKPFYKFRDVLDKDGKPLEFYMPPLVAEQFVSAFILQWQARNPDRHWPPSELVDKYHDKNCGYIPPLRREPFRKRDAPWMAPPDWAAERFDEKLNCFYADVAGERLYWSFDETGQRAWRNVIVTETQAEALAAAYEARTRSGGSSRPDQSGERR